MHAKNPGSNSPQRYLDDSYRCTFHANVNSVTPAGDRGYAVILNETFFYPESGGQTSDVGTIDGIDVTDVQESGKDVVHYLPQAPEPAQVECSVDWGRRFDHMQQHTGQHVLSRAFINVADADTVSFHMGDVYCTIDLNRVVAQEGAGPGFALGR